jgi:hypothetical protein
MKRTRAPWCAADSTEIGLKPPAIVFIVRLGITSMPGTAAWIR